MNFLNFKNIIDDLKTLEYHHKQLNSFGVGDIKQLIYLTQQRDKVDNEKNSAPIYPLMYVIPIATQQDLNFVNYRFNILICDIMNANNYDIEVDLWSSTLQIAQDILAQYKYSVTQQFGNYQTQYDLLLPTNITPFTEAYDDILVGWNLELSLTVDMPLDRCIAPFNPWETTATPTPSVTATNTPTPSITATLTNTPTETPTLTPTETPTNTPTETPTNTPTETPTNTPTETPTNTPTPTLTITPTISPIPIFCVGQGFDFGPKTIEYNNGSFYVGGSFEFYQGNKTPLIAKINATTGELSTTFVPSIPATAGNVALEINDITFLSSGKFFAGGFYQVGSPYLGLNLFNSDGSTDSSFVIPTAPNQPIRSIVVDSGETKVFVGGLFTSPSNRIVSYDMTGAINTSFVVGTGFNSSVNVIEKDPSNNLYVGGAFTTYKSIGRNRLVKIDQFGTIDATFTSGLGTGSNAAITDILYDNGYIYVVGGFTTINGVTRNRICRIDAVTGIVDPSWGGTGIGIPTGTVLSIGIEKNPVSGDIIVSISPSTRGGVYTYNGTQFYGRIFAVDLSGTLIPTFGSTTDPLYGFNDENQGVINSDEDFTFNPSNGDICWVGDFQSFNDEYFSYIVLTDLNGVLKATSNCFLPRLSSTPTNTPTQTPTQTITPTQTPTPTATTRTPLSPLWVGIGEGTNVLGYSTDGITWSASTNGNSIFTTNTAGGAGVVANGDIWVAAGQGTNSLAFSFDGITWSGSYNGFSLAQVGWGVAYNGNLWVGGMAASQGNTLVYSYDGINWVGAGITPLNGNAFAVASNGTGFVVAGNGNYSLGYSNDGITWSNSTNGLALTDNAYALAYNGSTWVYGGASGGTNKALGYSTDGITWSASTNGNTIFTSQVLSVGWNGSIWVAGGDGTNTLAYSTDGITWSGSANGNSFFTSVYGVAWNGSIWVAGGVGTNQLAYSTDGITWSASTNGNSIFSTRVYGVGSKPAPALYPPR